MQMKKLSKAGGQAAFARAFECTTSCVQNETYDMLSSSPNSIRLGAAAYKDPVANLQTYV